MIFSKGEKKNRRKIRLSSTLGPNIYIERVMVAMLVVCYIMGMEMGWETVSVYMRVKTIWVVNGLTMLSFVALKINDFAREVTSHCIWMLFKLKNKNADRIPNSVLKLSL